MLRIFSLICLLFVLSAPAQADVRMDAIKALAQSGDATAQNHLGVHYSDQQNYQYASVWFRRAAAQGDAFGQYGLATLYREGLGMPQDYTKAAKWYYKAAVQGDAKAQYHLGTLYYAGAGVQRDVKQAIAWFIKSAEGGDQRAVKYLKLINARNQRAAAVLEAHPSHAAQEVAASLQGVDTSDLATDSLGLIFLQGAGASVGVEAAVTWIGLPLLGVMGLVGL